MELVSARRTVDGTFGRILGSPRSRSSLLPDPSAKFFGTLLHGFL
jgi:hypothetical protein